MVLIIIYRHSFSPRVVLPWSWVWKETRTFVSWSGRSLALKSLCTCFPTGFWVCLQYICHVKWPVWGFIVPARCAKRSFLISLNSADTLRAGFWHGRRQGNAISLSWVGWSAGLDVPLPGKRKIRSYAQESHHIARSSCFLAGFLGAQLHVTEKKEKSVRQDIFFSLTILLSWLTSRKGGMTRENWCVVFPVWLVIVL